ncbi:succinylglutamate desuccinylase/aspartoacylase family protein [Streptomyces sp. NPDC005012]|uniref:succinylglutamate desuccinylase/aspartoacylase domain-containing protein n=1 Tax=Streptomyces sp. NPDC005012 TaxID=3154558 RepID=UPI0033B8C4AC
MTTSAPWTLAPLRPEPGRVVRGRIRVELGTTAVEVPLVVVDGAHPGPRVVFTAGMHGGEFTGIEAAARLADLLDPRRVHGQVVICPVANPPAVYDGRLAASPLDGVNINRVFPGDAGGLPTERLAAWHFTHLLAGADAYVDLHSGGIDEDLRDFVGHRLTGDPGLDRRTTAMAHGIGIADVIAGLDAGGGNSHAAAARAGVPAVLVESGRLGERDSEAADRLSRGLLGLLSVLEVVAPSDPAPPAGPVRAWTWAASVTAPATGLWYPALSAGDDVAAGGVLGYVRDPADGRRTPVLSPVTGRLFYGMRALTVSTGAELAALARRSGA